MSKQLALIAAAITLCCSLLFIPSSRAEDQVAPGILPSAVRDTAAKTSVDPQPVRPTVANPAAYNAVADYGTSLVNDGGEITIDAISLASETTEPDGRVRLEFNATLRNNNIGYFSRVHLLFEPSGVEWTDVEVVRDFTVYFEDLVPSGITVSPETLVLLAPAAVAATVRDQILAKEKLRIQAFELYQFRLPAVAIDEGAEDKFTTRIPLPDGTFAMSFSDTSPALTALGPGTLLLEVPFTHAVDRGAGGPSLPQLAKMISSSDVYAEWQEGLVRTTRMVEVVGKSVDNNTGAVTLTVIQHGGDHNTQHLWGPFEGPEYRGLINNLRTGTVSCSAATAFDPIVDTVLTKRNPYMPPLGNSAFTESEHEAREQALENLIIGQRVRHGQMRDLNGLFALHFPINNLQLAPGITLDGQVTLGGLNLQIDLKRRNNSNVVVVRLSTNADLNLRLTAQAGANNRGGPLLNREKTVVNVPLPPIIFSIAAVPVSIQPIFSAKIGATLDAPTSVVIPLQSSMEAGVRMEWDQSKPQGQQYSYEPYNTTRPLGVSKPGLTEALAFTASVFAETRMEILIEGFAGPYVGVRVTGDFCLTPLQNPWWNFDAGLDLKAGFLMKVLGIELADVGQTFPGPVFYHRDAGGPLGNNAVNALAKNASGSTGLPEPAEGAHLRWGRGAYWDGGAIPYDAILDRVAGSAEDVFTTLPAPNSIYSPVARIGAKGEIVWAKTSIGALPQALGAMPDGGLVVAGNSFGAHYLTRLDGAGNVIWSRDFDLVDDTGGPQNVYLKSIVTRETTPGNYEIFVCGYRDNGLNTLDTDPFLLKYDGAGTVLFSKRYASIDGEVVEQAILLQSGNLLFVGRNKKSPDGIGLPGAGAPDGGWLMKVAPDGTFIQALRTEAGLNMGYNSVTEAPDGTIFTGGTHGHTVIVEYPSLVIGRYSSDLQIEELVAIGEAMPRDKSNFPDEIEDPPPGGIVTPGFTDWLPNAGLTLYDFSTKLEWTPSGLIAGGITGLGNDRAPLLMCFTDKLNLRWFITEEGGSADTLMDFVTTDDGLLTAGFTTSMASPGTGAPGAVFFKVPYEGKVDLDPQVNGLSKFLQPSIYNLKNSFDDQNFPGPYQGYIGSFEMSLVSTSQATIPGTPPPPYAPFTFTTWTQLAQTNTAPAITTAAYSPLTREQGTTASNATIANGSDNQTSAGSLTVTATTLPTGITVTDIVNTGGTVTANVAADCLAALGDNTVVLEISDGALTSTANLIVNVVSNTAPTLTHGNASVVSAGSTTIDSASGPSDNGTVQTIALQSQGTYTGGISVNNATGQVSITNAAPVGTHTITIRATDNCGAITDSQFTLTITDAPNVCTAVVSNGNWSATATWGCGHVPTPGDTIIIPSGANVTLDIDPLGVSITVNAGAILNILGNRALLNNLIVNGTLNFSLSQSQAGNNPTVSANNILSTGNNVVSVGCAGTITGASASGFVVGNLQKDYCAASVFTYPVGTSDNGDEYSPVAVNVTALGATPSSLKVKANYGTAGTLGDGVTLDRFWTLTEIGDLTTDLTFNYLPTDVDGSESVYRLIRLTGGTAVTFPNQCPNAPCVDTTADTAIINGVSSFSDWTVGQPAAPTVANGTVSGQILDNNSNPVEGVGVHMMGTQNRLTVTDSLGQYRFENVETNGVYTVTPSRANFLFSPAQRSFSQLGNHTEASFTALPNGSGANAIDTAEYFVRQHYVDFLGREPDEAGFNFWSEQIASCGSDVGCLEVKRINVSAAYFLSIEFQETGGLVDGLYRLSYGRRPLYAEFIPDAERVAQNVIVGGGDWQQQLAANKQAFVEAFVQRSAFRAAYDNLSDSRYVDELIAHTGIRFEQSERDELVNGLAGNTLTRPAVLLRLADNERFKSAKRNEMFVMMEYFGYLRRDPDESGYQFWLNKLNQFGGDFQQAEMVKAFITSTEYRSRFKR